jgi:hypothetical protein
MSTVPPILPSWLERWAEGTLALPEQEIEPIVLSSGQIVACDPFVSLEGARPFARSVAPGRYKVRLTLSSGDVALACIRFGRAKVARWEVAGFAGRPPAGDRAPGYGVDSGTGCFVDAEVAARHLARERARYDAVSAKLRAEGVDPEDALVWHEAFESELGEGEADLLTRMRPSLDRRRWASLVLDDGGGNLLAFRSGAGDGVYPSYWGIDSRGRPAVLITDFDLLGEAEEVDEEDEQQASEDEEVEDVDLEDHELYAMALQALRRDAAPPASSPLLPRAKALLARWESSGKIALDEDCDRDAFAEALLEKLVGLEGHRHVGSHLAEWLMERSEVADVFASDDDLEADVRAR